MVSGTHLGKQFCNSCVFFSSVYRLFVYYFVCERFENGMNGKNLIIKPSYNSGQTRMSTLTFSIEPKTSSFRVECLNPLLNRCSACCIYRSSYSDSMLTVLCSLSYNFILFHNNKTQKCQSSLIFIFRNLWAIITNNFCPMTAKKFPKVDLLYFVNNWDWGGRGGGHR